MSYFQENSCHIKPIEHDFTSYFRIWCRSCPRINWWWWHACRSCLNTGSRDDNQEAMPVALLAICFSAMIGTIDGLKKRIVRYKAGIIMAAAGIVIAPFGIFLANILPSNILISIFSILLVVISLKVFWGLIKNTKPPTGHESLTKNCLINPATGKFNWSPRCFFTMSGIGGFTGIFTGMLGVGGGLIAPSIRYFIN